MSIRTEVTDGPRVRVTIADRHRELTAHEAEELIADLMERVDECEREERANAKARIQRMQTEYMERRARHG